MTLPADKYPYQAPVIEVVKAQVCHRYLDDNMWVTHPALKNWTQKSSLLDVIKQIHREFNSGPPQLAKSGASTEEAKVDNVIQKPDISNVERNLATKSEDELKCLVQYENNFEEFFNQLPEVKAIETNFNKVMT